MLLKGCPLARTSELGLNQVILFEYLGVFWELPSLLDDRKNSSKRCEAAFEVPLREKTFLKIHYLARLIELYPNQSMGLGQLGTIEDFLTELKTGKLVHECSELTFRGAFEWCNCVVRSVSKLHRKETAP